MEEEKQLRLVLARGNMEEISSFFELVYNKYKGLVSFVVAKYVQDETMAKDIIQDVFVQFFSNASNIHSNLRSYLTSCARNLSINYLKSQSKFVEFEEDMKQYDECFVQEKYAQIVREMKRILTSEEVEIILCKVIDDFTFQDLAKKFQKKENTIKTIYFRALKKLRKEGTFQ